MNRYLLDTNILVFLVTGEIDEISSDLSGIFDDYNNVFETSSVSIMELIQLYRIGKIRFKRGQNIESILESIRNDLFIKIVPFGEKHIYTMSKLDVKDGHNDPFDHAIISHAIADRYTLISSDQKFKQYKPQNLSFVYNKR